MRRVSKQHVGWLESQARIVRDGKVTHGLDGWLFLADDSNDAFAQHTGERRLSRPDLERWVSLLDRRAQLLEQQGCEYVLMVVPETHSVYPEKLPLGTPHATQRPVHQLIGALREAGAAVRVFYPLDEMVDAKAVRPVCSQIDSHWTDFGAFVAYAALLEQLGGRVATRRLQTEEVAFNETIGAGDLGNKLVPARLGPLQPVIVRYPEARLLYDNCIENTGSVVETVCGEAPRSTCLLLGDSYSYSLIKFISESFGRVVLAHSASMDTRLLRDVEPEVVVNLMAERFLIEVPDDDRDPGLSAHEHAKRQARRTRPPLTYWAGERRPSPLHVERLRAHFLADGRLADATIISALGYGGLLPRELTQLRWSDVGEGELRIGNPAASRMSGAPPARTVSMIKPLAADLREWRRAAGEPPAGARVFPGRDSPHWADGEWARWCAEVFDPAVQACGLSRELARPHDLRHTLCTLLLQEGRSAREVARRVGDKTRVIRELYGFQLSVARVAEAIDAGDVVGAIRRRRLEQADPSIAIAAPGSEPV